MSSHEEDGMNRDTTPERHQTERHEPRYYLTPLSPTRWEIRDGHQGDRLVREFFAGHAATAEATYQDAVREKMRLNGIDN